MNPGSVGPDKNERTYMHSTKFTANRLRPSLPLALYSAAVATALVVVTIAQIVGVA